MTLTEQLLTIVGEECNETAQRASKAIRFGLDEVQPNEHTNPAGLNNGERLMDEFIHLCAVMQMLGFNVPVAEAYAGAVAVKKQRVNLYFQLSRARGTLTEADRADA